MKGLIVYNPTAGPRDVHQEIQRVQRELERRGWSLEIKTPHHPEENTRLARQAAEDGLDAVWVAGGDGTINKVINGLVETETALGVLPVGTGNIWARQLHLPVFTLTHPFHLREAAIAQSTGERRIIDVGLIDDRYFLLWAGAGFDAQVTQKLEPRDRMTKRLGFLPYIIAAITLAREFSGVRTRLELDGRVIRGRTLLAVASNIQMYAIFQMARRAQLDDGLLDVFVFKGMGFGYILRHAAKVFSGRHLQDPRVVHRQAREVTIWTDEPMVVQVDGDPIGTTPVSLQVVPRVLHVLVPSQASKKLFLQEES